MFYNTLWYLYTDRYFVIRLTIECKFNIYNIILWKHYAHILYICYKSIYVYQHIQGNIFLLSINWECIFPILSNIWIMFWIIISKCITEVLYILFYIFSYSDYFSIHILYSDVIGILCCKYLKCRVILVKIFHFIFSLYFSMFKKKINIHIQKRK